jgi:transmembrane 9 superfamily protein 2/4
MLLTVLTFIVAFILLAALRKDIAQYNEEDALEGQDDTIGWKLVHGDVFRAPRYLGLLSIFLGTGIQLIAALGFTLAFAVIGILNPSYRGGTVQYGVFFFAICGVFGGYHGARLSKSFKNSKTWLWTAIWVSPFA